MKVSGVTVEPYTKEQLEANEEFQLCKWVEFENGTRVFLELLPKYDTLVIALKHKNAKTNSLYESFKLKKVKIYEEN